MTLEEKQKAMRERHEDVVEISKTKSKPCLNEKEMRMVKLDYADKNLRKRYGLTMAKYQAMLGKQGGACLICLSLPALGKTLCVDHNHKTGKIRSLLCRSCNLRVGVLETWPFLITAIQYLALDGEDVLDIARHNVRHNRRRLSLSC